MEFPIQACYYRMIESGWLEPSRVTMTPAEPSLRAEPSHQAEPPHTELGEFLRSRRDRLTPQAVGLPAGQRRRTPGLRREEVAQLAGIGVAWYIRLEQGQPVSPSTTTVDALARALRLNPVEHAHLRALTRNAERRPFEPEVVPASLRQTVMAMNLPAYVTGRRWDVLAWNQAAAEVFAFDRVPEADRNTLIQVLTNPKTRQLFGAGWADEARRMVAQFRATHDLWPGEPAFLALIERLRAGCPEFAGWWEAHDLREMVSGAKRLSHPRKGALKLRYVSLQPADDPGLRLVIYSPG